MRIASVANFYGPRSGGLRTTMHALGEGYEAAGHDSVLVVPGERAGRERTPAGLRITVPSRRVPGTGGYRVIADTDSLRALLVDLQPDRLEVGDRTTLVGLGRWARARGLPAVAWAHERLDGVLGTLAPGVPGPLRTDVVDRWNTHFAERFDKVVATTGYAAAELERVGAPNVARVPLGVDLRRFSPERADTDLRRRFVQHDEALLVLCSRLSVEKQPWLAVRALRHLVASGVRARLVIAGSGPGEPRLRREASGLPVTMLGFVRGRDEVAALLASADLVIAPGPIETFGLAALEALASGTAVVASRTSALPEVIGGDPAAGAWCDPSGPALGEAAAAVLAVPADERRDAARTRAETFPWTSTVARMLALHASLETSETTALPIAPRPRLPRAKVGALVRASYARTLSGAAQPRTGRGPRVVALGDSIALGVGDLVPPDYQPGWTAHVAHALDASAYLNLAALGARTRTVLDEQLGQAVAARPDLVLVSAGGNDVLRGDLDDEDVATATAGCVTALQAVGCSVVLTVLPPVRSMRLVPRPVLAALQKRVDQVNTSIEAVAQQQGVALVRAGAAANQRSWWHVDRIHPGPLGHRGLAGGALVELRRAGFRQWADVPPLAAAEPGRAAQVGWLVRNGSPWLAKRSVDLVPALGRQLLAG